MPISHLGGDVQNLMPGLNRARNSSTPCCAISPAYLLTSCPRSPAVSSFTCQLLPNGGGREHISAHYCLQKTQQPHSPLTKEKYGKKLKYPFSRTQLMEALGGLFELDVPNITPPPPHSVSKSIPNCCSFGPFCALFPVTFTFP